MDKIFSWYIRSCYWFILVSSELWISTIFWNMIKTYDNCLSGCFTNGISVTLLFLMRWWFRSYFVVLSSVKMFCFIYTIMLHNIKPSCFGDYKLIERYINVPKSVKMENWSTHSKQGDPARIKTDAPKGHKVVKNPSWKTGLPPEDSLAREVLGGSLKQ